MAGFMGIPVGTVGTQPGATDFSPYINMRRIQIEAELEQRRQQQLAEQNAQALTFQYDQLAQSQKLAEANALQRQAEFKHQQGMDIEQQLLRERQFKEDQMARAEQRDQQAAMLRQRQDEQAAGEAKQKAAEAKLGELEAVKAKSATLIPQAVANLRGQNPTLTAEQIRDQLMATPPEGASPDEWLVIQQNVQEWYKSEKVMERERAIQEDRDLERQRKIDEGEYTRILKERAQEQRQQEIEQRKVAKEQEAKIKVWDARRKSLDSQWAAAFKQAQADRQKAEIGLQMAQARLAQAQAAQPVNVNAVSQAQAQVAAFTNMLTRANATIEQRNAAYDAAAKESGIELTRGG